MDGEACVLALGIDITEHKRLDAVRTYTDQLFSMDESVSVDVLLQTALNAAEEITESSTGFCHFIGDERIGDQPAQIWSSNAARMLEHAGIVSARRDHLNSSDIWKDIIESKQAVIHNDGASIRKIRGIPSDAPSHISRELLIPLKKSGQVAAIFGVANKPFNYTDDDMAIVTRIASLMWNVVSRRIAEESVRRIKSSVEPKAAIRSGHSSRPHTRHGS
ncbi:GAF domain-containing protein [Chlorobium phaeovibrioides]|uniref:GAF domain-containing protein n=1 Tax=Chlorobium phaeovibrioides TaxID=1094 RepID=UPI001CB8B542|nr:GAF domain-containing protein [Chlorobium phaeovibrioides]